MMVLIPEISPVGAVLVLALLAIGSQSDFYIPIESFFHIQIVGIYVGDCQTTVVKVYTSSA
jgi:hypothetical protein